MKIIFEDNHLLIVAKPINMPVCEDDSRDLDLLSELKLYLKERYHKPGNVYLGLVHRLDRPVGGIMVFAKTSKAASRLSDQIRNRLFEKEYMAIIEGKLSDKGNLIDRLLKDKVTNITTVNETGKEASLSYELISFQSNYSLVKINLKTGRSHQIRVQFASRGFPLYGDQKYNKEVKTKQQIALYATQISFLHPITEERVIFKIDIPDTYPWNLFK